MSNPLWSPSSNRVENSNMYKFMKHLGMEDKSYVDFHKYSVESSGEFWNELIKFFDISYEGELSPINTDTSFKSYGWYPNMKLSFSENLLKHGLDDSIAINSILENGSKSSLTFKELKENVSGLREVLSSYINEGDVLACYMPNIEHTPISMLATTSLGGVFTSTSADFGIEGVVDRFGQSRPKVLVTVAGYEYGGKYFDLTNKIKEVKNKVDSIEKVVVIDFLKKGFDTSEVSDSILWDDFFTPSTNEIIHVKRKFSDPLYIMYSSGTTGKPKCIVHSVGGTLLQHVKELGLHTDLTKDKNIFYFTTCGWMMWNWLVSSLFFGGTTTLYEGSPAYPTFNDFVSLIEKEKINIFGTSPKFLRALEDGQTNFSDIDLSSLETILSTGAPLLPEQYDYVYNSIKSDVLLASISGGTDIIGCFFLGCPIMPVYRGELQCSGLGMNVACFDDNGNILKDSQGELVCLTSFPSRPIYFLNDNENERINDAYFNRFENIWHHGDYIQITPRSGAIVFGRSDATLNPGGVRIGTSEIYRQTETLSFVEDSVCVGKQVDGDVDVWLFVKMAQGHELDSQKIKEIKKLIKDNTTPRHIPRRVIQVDSIPYTRSGKKMEMAVTKLINGKQLNNVEAVANPESLDQYKGEF